MPFTFVPFIAYNFVVFYIGPQSLFTVVFAVDLPSFVHSDGNWKISTADMIMMMALLFLYVEIFKATRTSQIVIFDHALSIGVFVLYLVEFLLLPEAGTSLFFMLTLIALIDVLAGLTVTLTGARRDIHVDG